MSMTPPLNDAAEERTLGQLVVQASEDVSTIVRSEIALAKAEVTSGLKVAGMGVGMFGAAAFLVLLAVILLLQSAATGIAAAGLPLWAGYLIVAAVILLVAAILALIGKKAMSKASPVPAKAIDHAQKTVATLTSR